MHRRGVHCVVIMAASGKKGMRSREGPERACVAIFMSEYSQWW